MLLLIVFSVQNTGSLSELFTIEPAEAAQVTIDNATFATPTSHIQSGSQTVFTNDQTGYKFYRDSTGVCVYSKTSNGGTSWGAAVTVDSQTDCIQIQVWYDKWTPGIASASSSIHIVTFDTGNDDIWYNRLDTSNDSLLLGSTPVSMLTGSGQAGNSITEGENFTSITRGTDGTIYALSNDGTGNNDSFIVECTVSCQTAANWTETGVNPLDIASDQSILVPLASGNIMLINRDISADDIRSKIWNNSTWAVSWTTIDANATENATYDVGMAAAVSSTTPGVVYLAYIANNATLGTDDVIRTARYNGSNWAAATDVINSTTRGLTNVAIALNTANDDVYVAYTGQTTAGTANTGNVYWKTATSSMTNWSSESSVVNTSADDLYGLDLNIGSDQRMYVSWFDNTDDDIYGDTIADVFPGINVTVTGSQTATTDANVSNVYMGGAFVLYNTYVRTAYDVTAITITESGTINGSTGIANVKLFYEMDTTAPYNCASVSYDGTESQFGSTDTNGFSGADGVSSFSGTTVSISTTTAMCAYAVLDVPDTASSSVTIDLSINAPNSDVTVTSGTAGPSTAQNISGTTLVHNDAPTLSHFHWRNDNGSETLATSRTGGSEDVALTALQQNTPVRLRIGISNEGSTSTGAMQYRLEYGTTTSSCTATTFWTDVGGAGGDFDMYDSTHVTEGTDTTNISVAAGGVSDENTSFVTPNGGVKDTSSQTGAITLSATQFVELEYAIIASTSAAEGNSYCFRVTNAGNPLTTYSVLPRANIAADVLITVSGSSQTTTTTTPAVNFYVGAPFIATDNTGSHTVTSITIAEDGTADGTTDLDNIRILYDLDTSNPYDCSGESYAITDTQFGSTDADGFSNDNGTSTFTDTANISTTATMCAYVVLDTTATAQNAETINILMPNPSSNFVISGGGSVSPTVARDLNGDTTLEGPVLTQTHYHWRNDNGSESAATSLTGGAEDTDITNVAQSTPVRLRMQMSNEGSVSSPSRTYFLQYGTKISTCSAISSWNDVGDVGGAFDMYDSSNLTNGADTTNISVAAGGVSDENTTFLTPNGGVRDTSSQTGSIALTNTQYLETEFSIRQTTDAGFDTTYCFRLMGSGDAVLQSYLEYPELTTAPERDFEIQRGTATITGTSVTLTAGVDYVAPAASTSAFIRITNTHHTGAGSTGAGTQNADDVTAYIQNPSNIVSSITIARPSTATGNTRVSWEIVEFIGEAGSDNEMVVRSQSAVTYGAAATSVTGPTVAGVSDDADVVVFITGQLNPDTTNDNYNTGQSTAAWSGGSNEPVFTRGEAGADASMVSYAVVEFTGINWSVQRSEHTYTDANTIETESIAAVNSLSRTFIHTQKRSGTGLNGTDEFGHEVWLSSVGFISYFLESGATTPSGQTSVAWVIENIQITTGAMDVTRSNGNSLNGAEPLTLSISIGKTLMDLTNASIFVNSRSEGSGVFYPRPIAGAIIASTTHYELWRSDTGSTLTYRTEIVEWPTAGLSIRQNYYRLYVDNNSLDPTDPWPLGATDVGENTAVTASDEPLGEGERIRIRMSLQISNATLPTSTRAFKLQYAALNTTCSAVGETAWHTAGDAASSTLWRGYAAPGIVDGTELSTNPPAGGGLNLSVSDVAGTFEELNDSAPNPYSVQEGDDIEYDWLIEQNGANAETYYCFRMVESDGTMLDGYLQYPQIRTASFVPRTQNWRWFDDEQNFTPSVVLAGENTAPIDIANTQTIVLRVTVKEIKNVAREDVRFKLQYSEYPDFSVVADVVASSTCIATSTWCYGEGAGTDNNTIVNATLSDADACVNSVGTGCGTYNESSRTLTGHRHENNAASEYSFVVQSAAPRVNTVYYFRLYDVVEDIPVTTNTDEAYPSVVTEGASLTFNINGIAATTVVEGVTTDVTTSAVTVPYGTLSINQDVEAAHRLQVSTNAPEGYQIYLMSGSDLISSTGATIPSITTTNSSPGAWNTSCAVDAVGCFGYHGGDDTLDDGSTRFAANDSYARFSTTTLDEVVYNGGPATNDTIDMVYKVKARALQSAGQYTTSVRYIAVPVF